MAQCILHGWILTLPLQMQFTLLLAIRQFDLADSCDSSRIIIHEYRKLILKEFNPTTPVEELNSETQDRDFRKAILKWINDLNKYNLNFINAIMQSSAIIGYKHPEVKIRRKWFDIYTKIAQRLNIHIETENDLNIRFGE